MVGVAGNQQGTRSLRSRLSPVNSRRPRGPPRRMAGVAAHWHPAAAPARASREHRRLASVVNSRRLHHSDRQQGPGSSRRGLFSPALLTYWSGAGLGSRSGSGCRIASAAKPGGDLAEVQHDRASSRRHGRHRPGSSRGDHRRAGAPGRSTRSPLRSTATPIAAPLRSIPAATSSRSQRNTAMQPA